MNWALVFFVFVGNGSGYGEAEYPTFAECQTRLAALVHAERTRRCFRQSRRPQSDLVHMACAQSKA